MNYVLLKHFKWVTYKYFATLFTRASIKKVKNTPVKCDWRVEIEAIILLQHWREMSKQASVIITRLLIGRDVTLSCFWDVEAKVGLRSLKKKNNQTLRHNSLVWVELTGRDNFLNKYHKRQWHKRQRNDTAHCDCAHSDAFGESAQSFERRETSHLLCQTSVRAALCQYVYMMV